MAESETSSALKALALVGLGAITFRALERSSQRRRFKEALKSYLGEGGIGFVDASLGRFADGRLFWGVVVNHPQQGILQRQVAVPAGATAVSVEALQAILDAFAASARSTRP